MTKEVMKQALDALKIVWEEEEEISAKAHQVVFKAIKSLEEALKQEQDKEWVGLTDEDIENCFDESCHLKVVDPKGGIKGSVNIFEVGRAIVQLCKERNT